MKASAGKVVEVSYELNVDGQVADRATREKPLAYIHGGHMLIARFEAGVEGLEPGERFAFVIPPEEGYGVYDPSHVIKLPMAAFQMPGGIPDGMLAPGRVIPMMDSQGQVLQGKVVEVLEDSVRMDFNHPMAGKTLNFTGEVISVREATEKELKEGLHGEYLPPKEGCCHGKGKCRKHGKEDGECCHGEGHDGDCGCHEDGGECHCKEK